MLEEQLKKQSGIGSVTTVFCEDGGEYVGRILGMDQEDVLVASITYDGVYDGFGLIPLERIHAVSYDGAQEEKTAALYQLHHSTHPALRTENREMWAVLLEFAEKNSRLVTAETEDANFTGAVTAWDDGTLSLKQVTVNGLWNGGVTLRRDCITCLNADTIEEQSRRLLLEHRQKQAE